MAEPRGRRPSASDAVSAQRSPKVDAPRRAAYDVLAAVREDGAYANLALATVLRDTGLTGRDAAFTTELVVGHDPPAGHLRRRAGVAGEPGLGDVDPAVLDSLRLGSHQLLSMRVPAHAAVGTTVDLVRAVVGPPTGRLRERRAAQGLRPRSRRVGASGGSGPGVDPLGFAATVHSHPRWVVEALAEALGSSAEALDELLVADNAPPRVMLVARPGSSSVEELVAAGGTPGSLSPYAVELAGGEPGAIPAVRDGRAGVQDEGSQLVALALSRAVVEGRDDRWLDLCAGPGGKAALLAGLAAERGAGIVAAELQPHRAALVARTLAGAPGVLGTIVADGTSAAWGHGSFDRVLVDAPCSGLGALRRRPEARWRKSADDLTGLVPLQEALLEAAIDAVRPGGVVLYATCSPLLRETSGVVTAVQSRRDDVAIEDAAPLLPELTRTPGPNTPANTTANAPSSTPATAPPNAETTALPGALQLWPHVHGTDAMFLALLRKTR